jgi:Lysyl oxidase/WD40-like Beta Propeller Repeat
VSGRLVVVLGAGLPALVLGAFAIATPAAARAPAPATVTVRGGDLVVGGAPVTSGAAVDVAPDWSPDGRRIAFSRQRPGGRGSALMTVRRDGGGLRRLTDGRRVDTHAAWSPDGRRIAFASAALTGGTFDIRVIGERGGRSRVLVGGPAEDVAPSWSADGRRLLFVRVTAAGAERWEARADGTRQRRLGQAAADEALERTLDRSTPRSGPRELLPDLDQRPPAGLTVSGTRLGFDSATDNVGDGPLWLRGERAGTGDPLFVRQLVRLSDGGVRMYEDAGRLWYTPHPPHFHWHLLGFQRFELRRASDFALVVRDRKTGFCLADHYGHAAQRVRNFGPPVFLGNCEQGRPGALAVEQGSSPGYTDRYPAHFHGQDLELRGVPAGVYVLVHRANEHGLIEELDYTNNAASLRLRLDWAGSTPQVTVLRTCAGSERC